MNDKRLQKHKKFVVTFSRLLNANDFKAARNELEKYILETGDSLNVAGCMIDLGSNSGNEKEIKRGIEIYENALKTNESLTNGRKQAYYYNIGNGYFSLYEINKKNKGSSYRAFIDNKYLLEATKCFKLSIDLGNNEPSLYTNYANLLDVQGRNLEAIKYYDKAIKRDAKWGMAYANKAISIIALARISGEYQTAQYILAYQLLQKALENRDSVIKIGGTQALTEFEARSREIEKLFTENKELLTESLEHTRLNTDVLSESLRNFYQFAIDNDLFLNLHIQDNKCEAATFDHVFISLVTPVRDNDSFYKFAGWINEMKESYMTARYLLFESQNRSEDKSTISKLTKIVYPLDYSTKTIYTGLLKASIKESFSILDKIAYFLNDYLKLEIKNEESINWQNVWFRELKVSNPKHWFEDKCTFHHKIKNVENYTLFSLFSLFLDIKESKFANLRHQLTHKKILVKIEGKGNNKDEFTVDKLEDSAVMLLHFTKYSIIYLINFVNSQENSKGKGCLLAPVYVITDQFI